MLDNAAVVPELTGVVFVPGHGLSVLGNALWHFAGSNVSHLIKAAYLPRETMQHETRDGRWCCSKSYRVVKL